MADVHSLTFHISCGGLLGARADMAWLTDRMTYNLQLTFYKSAQTAAAYYRSTDLVAGEPSIQQEYTSKTKGPRWIIYKVAKMLGAGCVASSGPAAVRSLSGHSLLACPVCRLPFPCSHTDLMHCLRASVHPAILWLLSYHGVY